MRRKDAVPAARWAGVAHSPCSTQRANCVQRHFFLLISITHFHREVGGTLTNTCVQSAGPIWKHSPSLMRREGTMVVSALAKLKKTLRVA